MYVDLGRAFSRDRPAHTCTVRTGFVRTFHVVECGSGCAVRCVRKNFKRHRKAVPYYSVIP